MKKIVSSLSVALLLSLSSISTTHATQLEGASSWATALLQTAISSNIVPEELQNNYTQATTRAEFCQLAVATYEEATGQEITERKTFSDTNDVNVEKMAGLGVVAGTGGTSFTPNRSLNREEAALILANLLESLSINMTETTVSFDDSADISNWASVAVGKVSQAQVMSGVGNNLFAPKDSYDREQSMVTMLRVFEATQSENNQEITSITITPNHFFLSEGESVQLTVMSNIGEITEKVTWTTTHPDYFHLENGVVTLIKKASTAKIIATAENGSSTFTMGFGKIDDIVTTITDYGNVYGKFPEILAFENIKPDISLLRLSDSRNSENSINSYYIYEYQTYYQEEAGLLAEDYANYLVKRGFSLIEVTDYAQYGYTTKFKYRLLSPSEKYSIILYIDPVNTDLHLSGEIQVWIYYENGTINDDSFTPGFDSSLIDKIPEIQITPPSTTSPSLTEEEISAIRIEALKDSVESVRCLTETISHLGDAIDRGTQGTALLDCTEAIMDFMQSGTYAMYMIEKIAPLAEVDNKYVEMNELLFQYCYLVAEICEDFLAQDPTTDFNIMASLDSSFLSMLRNLTTDIDNAAVYLRQATDIFYD